MNRTFAVALSSAVLSFLAPAARAAVTLSAPYSSDYTLVDLGIVPGNQAGIGGLLVNPGNTNQLFVAAQANLPTAVINSIGLSRNVQGHITGFSGSATLVSTAAGGGGGGIDSGLIMMPDGVLVFTSYSDNQLGMIKPGSTSPDKLVDLTPLGIQSSVGNITIVPSGFPNAGAAMISSYDFDAIYSAYLLPDGSGTYDVVGVQLPPVFLGPFVGVEGMAYVHAGMPSFGLDSVLICEFKTKQVVVYELDATSYPIPGTGQVFATGAQFMGSTYDPVTGDLLLSVFSPTLNANHVYAVQGFVAVPEPATWTLLALGCAALGVVSKRKRRQSP